MAAVGAVTIGQSPRPDIVGEIQPLLGPRVPVVEIGALDGLASEEIDALRPDDDDDALVSLLRDGREVLISRRRLLPRLQACFDRLQDQVGLILMLCTGTFPPFRTGRLVLYPEHLLFQMAQAIAHGVRVGVLTPSAWQVREQERRWAKVASAVTVRPFSPYTPGDDLEGACAAFADARVDVVALDCLGYTVALKQEVKRLVDRPVLLARSIVGRLAAEILE